MIGFILGFGILVILVLILKAIDSQTNIISIALEQFKAGC